MDGSEPAYVEAASAKGLTPNLDRIMQTGASTHAYSVIPSFTNPNNLSIITGPAARRARHLWQLFL
jgi:phosphonoacetate hydrolase